MRRSLKILLVTGVVLAGLLAVNAVVLDSQTRPAELSAPGAEILELSSVQLQVADQPATGPGPEGAPVVLLHCFGCSSRWWDEIAPALNEQHRVIRIDLIGHGGSAKPASGYEITAQAAAVAEALNELGVSRATVVGHSMGGSVATALAEGSSELVDRAVIIGSASSPGGSELPALDGLVRTPVLGQALWRVRLDPLIESGYESAFAPGFDFQAAFEDPDQVVADNRAMTYRSYSGASEASGDFISEQPLASRLTATGVPLLVILGAEDQIVDTQQAESDYAAVPGATVETLDGVGHSPNLEAPAETAAAILSFAGAGEGPAAGQRRRGGERR